jgi:phospholipid/cholesterol/gamma-HCH transport system permease protein
MRTIILPASTKVAIKKSSTMLKDFFIEVGSITKFAGHFFKEVFRPQYEFKELMKQSYLIGNKTLLLAGLSGFIMGIVLTIQSRPGLVLMGATSMLPSLDAQGIIKEMGPAITALICAGKIGSSIGAELSSMKVSEQIDAMEVSGTKPFKYLVVTRIAAATIMIPILVIVSDFISLLGAFFACNLKDSVSLHLFFSEVFRSISFVDLFSATIKTVFFGFAIGLIGCYMGYTSSKGTEGVGKAANSAVVVSSLLIFIIDAIAVQITSFFV